MNERIEGIARLIHYQLEYELEQVEKTSFELPHIGITITAILCNEVYIVQVGTVVEYGIKADGLYKPIFNAIKRATTNICEIGRDVNFAKFAKTGIDERMKKIRGFCKDIIINVRDIESCAKRIPELVEANDSSKLGNVRNLIWANNFHIENNANFIKQEIVNLL